MNDPDLLTSSPRSRRLLISLLIVALLLAAVGIPLWRWHVRHTPEYALEVVTGIKNRADLANAYAYLTDQGRKVASFTLDNQNDPIVPSPGQPMQYQPVRVHGTLCDVPFIKGDAEGYLRFEQHGVWQFHDCVFTRIDKHDLEMSLAYFVDHPVRASLKAAGLDSLFSRFFKESDSSSKH